MKSIQFYSDKINKLSTKKAIYEEKISELKRSIKIATKNIDTLEKAQAFIQKVAQDTQSQLKFQITEIVQLALDACWPNEKVFSLEFEIKNNRTVAQLKFVDNGNIVDPTDEDGGGVVDVASFSLRLAAWSLGKTAPIILVDEPFKMLSIDLSEKIADIIKELSERLGVQFLMVTSHGLDMNEISNKVFEVTKSKGISIITEV
jgi:DNA repair exonuclease SbcCD ATPase subunit